MFSINCIFMMFDRLAQLKVKVITFLAGVLQRKKILLCYLCTNRSHCVTQMFWLFLHWILSKVFWKSLQWNSSEGNLLENWYFGRKSAWSLLLKEKQRLKKLLLFSSAFVGWTILRGEYASIIIRIIMFCWLIIIKRLKFQLTQAITIITTPSKHKQTQKFI